MPERPSVSQFKLSLFATPSPSHQEVFYTVPRAGHLVAGPDHHVKRDHFPGHELIFCLRGKGFVRVEGVRHEVGAGDLVWINCQHPHEHGALAADPWEVYWIRTEGPRLAAMCRMLSTAQSPAIAVGERAAVEACYREIFTLMQADRPEAPALMHAEVARLLAHLFCARQALPDTPSDLPQVLRKPFEWMKLFYFQKVSVEALARQAGVSPGHFARLFRATFGTSPIDWLRRERISQAKRRLVEGTDSIKEIAEQVGYADRFFFSKDFKKHTGFSPREFREVESAGRGRASVQKA